MRTRTKWGLSAGALCLAALAVSPADAGNVDEPTAQYFSVRLLPGFSVQYSGSDSDAVMLVDDVTYACSIDPCYLHERCSYFAEEDIWAMYGTLNLDDPPGPLGNFNESVVSIPVPGSAGIKDVRQQYDTNRTHYWSKAVGTDYMAILQEQDSQGLVHEFDRFSHSVHSELLARQRMERFREFHRYSIHVSAPGEQEPLNNVYDNDWNDQYFVGYSVGGAGAGGLGLGIGVGLSSYAVSTSGSRHYQSPQVVQHGNKVSFWIEQGFDQSDYSRAICYVKGRIILDSTVAPVETTDVQVTNQ